MLGESSATTFATKMIKSEECSDDMDPPSTLQLQTAPDVTDINIEVKGIEVKLEPPTSYSGLATSGNHYGVRDADGNEKSSATVMHQNSSSDNSVSNINFVFSNPVNPMADALRNVSSNVIFASCNNTSNMVSALSNNTSDIVSASNSNTSDMVFVSSSSTTNMVSALSNTISDVVSASSNNTADMFSASSNNTSDMVSALSNNTCDVVLLDMVAHNVDDDETNEHNVKNDEMELVNVDIKHDRLETMTESKTVLKSKEEKKEDVDESREKTVQCKECKIVFTNPHVLEWHVLYSQRNGIRNQYLPNFYDPIIKDSLNTRGGYCGWRRIAIRYDTARAYCNTYCNILGILCTVIFRLPKLMLCLFGARISFMMFKNCIIKSWVYDHLMMTFCLQSLGDCSCPVYLFFP